MTAAPPPGPYGNPAGFPPPKHPQATTVLILGILGVVLCGVLAPFAWVMGNKAIAEIRASPGTYGGESEVNAGRILGIIGTVLLALGLIVIAIGIAFIGLFSVGTAVEISNSTGY